jgi:hypothetical protein
VKCKSKISTLVTFTLALSFISLIPAQADEPCYSVVEGVLTNGSACAGAITIDSSVTSIGDSAFQNVAAVTSVFIPGSVVHIGSNAFAGSGLTSVTLPGTVATIGNAAFQQIQNLTTVTIGEGITSLPSQAFYNNFSASILEISLPSTLTSIGDAAFFGAGITSLTIPNSVTSIGDQAFQDTAALMSVTIGEGVTEIGSSAFWNSALTTLTIPNSVTTIGAYAFGVNRGLTSITIGSGVTNIGTMAFQDNSALTSISFLGNQPIVGDNAFVSTPSGVISYIPSTADGFVVGDDRLWNGFTISRVVAPSITLAPPSEERTVNASISGYTITSIGDTITSFTISPAAPAGLTFSTVTGLLTGAPTSVSPATIYTISARNVGGVSTATFTLTVRAVAPVSDNSAANAAAAAAAERAAAAKREAREGILSRLKDGQGLTIESFVKAQISGITPENFAEVQAELLNLPETSRSDINQILKVAYKYEVVGKIGSDRVSYLLPNAFVEIGLIPLVSKNKVALVAAVKRLPLGERKNYAAIKAEIDKQIVKIQARKDRLASLVDRNAKRSGA